MHTPAWTHIPVLLHEAIDAIVGDADGIYVDGTFIQWPEGAQY